jgi:ribosomal protein S6E (S10)
MCVICVPFSCARSKNKISENAERYKIKAIQKDINKSYLYLKIRGGPSKGVFEMCDYVKCTHKGMKIFSSKSFYAPSTNGNKKF